MHKNSQCCTYLRQMCTFQESNSTSNFFAPFSMGSTLQGKNLLLWSILFLKSSSQFERASTAREANSQSQILSPFVIQEAQDGPIPMQDVTVQIVCAMEIQFESA